MKRPNVGYTAVSREPIPSERTLGPESRTGSEPAGRIGTGRFESPALIMGDDQHTISIRGVTQGVDRVGIVVVGKAGEGKGDQAKREEKSSRVQTLGYGHGGFSFEDFCH